MTHYIGKDALVAEIKKIYNEDYKFLPSDIAENIQDFKDDVLRNIDTLEVKEVDLEKEIKKWKNEHGIYGMDDLDFIFAKHFFELGLKAQKEESTTAKLKI